MERYIVEVDDSGAERWYQDDKLHRNGDKPAIIYADGNKYWFQNDKRHRDGDKPAIIFANGEKRWYQDDKLHRDGGEPAIIYPTGEKRWFQRGVKMAEPKLTCHGRVIEIDGVEYILNIK